MTVQLSPHKIGKILRNYFRGLPQTKIAEEAGVDQSSVSHYATRFKEMTARYGLTTVGKEYQVLNEVESLRSLSVELYKSMLTVEEAKYGVRIMETFIRLGVDPDQYTGLIDVCKKVENPEFINAALEFMEIENNSDKGYDEIISSFQRITSQLPLVEKELDEKKTELGSLNNILTRKKRELARIQSQLVQIREEVIAEKTRLNAELEAEMTRLEVKKQELKEVNKLKSELAKRGLNISTLINVAEEFHDDSN